MLRELKLQPVPLPQAASLPEFMQPLVSAAAAGNVDLTPHVVAIVQAFGFTDMTYGATAETQDTPTGETLGFVYTTKPSAWVRRYDEMAYMEVDPRVRDTWDNPLPLVWDQRTFENRDARTRAYGAEALAHGVGSGVAMSFHLGAHRHVIFMMNSPEPLYSDVRRNFIDRRLGDMTLLGMTFHSVFLRGVIEAGIPPAIQGVPLSAREREVLAYVAKGLTDEDIAELLGIAVPTVGQHMSHIRSKLGAANRAEAAVLAVRARII